MGGILGSISKILNPISSFLGPIGSILGAVSGAQGLFGGDDDKKYQEQPIEAAQAPAFKPTRPEGVDRPESLNELAAYSPEQERSYLATRGVQGGLGDEEESYYRNLLQRSLIGEGNQVQGQSEDFLMPIESQYFSQKGINTGNIMDFLQGISA